MRHMREGERMSTVRIKRLKFVRRKYENGTIYYKAETPIGTYWIDSLLNVKFMNFVVGSVNRDIRNSRVESVADGKRKCQAHFEGLIIPCLEIR